MSYTKTKTRALAISVAVFAVVLQVLWFGMAQAQSPTPDVNLPTVNQIDLTEETAANAMFAFRDFKKKYGDAAPPDSDAQAYVRAMLASSDMQATARRYGFADTNDWYQTLFSFVMAHAVATEGNYEQMKKSMAAIRNNPDLPDEVKKQVAASLGGLLPPEGNIKVARSMAANPDYAAMIAEFK